MKTNVEVRSNQLKAISAKAKYMLISAVLGCLGSINIVLIGVHACMH